MGLVYELVYKQLLEIGFDLDFGLVYGLVVGLVFGLGWGLVNGLVEPRSVLVTSRTPKETNSRSLVAALIWLVFGLVVGQVQALVFSLVYEPIEVLTLPRYMWAGRMDSVELIIQLVYGLALGVIFGLSLGLRNGGGFVMLQKVAHRHLARSGNLPRRPADFLEWGIERQIFRRVGGGVRFRHNLIQQHLAKSH